MNGDPIWSLQQKAIYGELATGRRNFVGRARAGTGKSTTIAEGTKHAHERRQLVCAFNKRIVEEFLKRGTKADVKTLHSVGLGQVRTYWPDITWQFNSERQDDLTLKVCGQRVPDTIKSLISKLHTKGREIAPHAVNLGDLTHVMQNFELEPDEEWWDLSYTPEFVEQKALEAMQLAADVKPTITGIDGADMIFLPVRNHWLHRRYDLVIVDEAQDMTTAQLEIAVGVCNGRVVIVGDDRQAIYGFRGADSGSIDRLKAELKAEEFGLTTTYRCGRLIVDEARRLVPDFEAGPDNPDGEVLELQAAKLTDMAQPGDFVISRLNAPLVNVAMALLRRGRRARIAGRDIGAGLISLVKKLRARSVTDFLDRLAIWEAQQVERMIAARRDVAVQGIRDKAAMLVELATDATSVEQVRRRIEDLFADDGLGDAGVVTCSSVHKAKGLEANRVFILADTLRDHDIEELNIQYVAITRAKKQLTYVRGRV